MLTSTLHLRLPLPTRIYWPENSSSAKCIISFIKVEESVGSDMAQSLKELVEGEHVTYRAFSALVKAT